MQRLRLSDGARGGPFITFRPPFINQAPDVKPSLDLLFGNVRGGAAGAHHSESARKDIRNLRQVLRMRPIFFRHVVLNLRRHPIPRVPLLAPKEDAKIGLRIGGNREYPKVPERSAWYFAEAVRATLVGSGPGENGA